MAKTTQEDVLLLRALWDDQQVQKGLERTTASLNAFTKRLLPKAKRDEFIPFDVKTVSRAQKQMSAVIKRQEAEKLRSFKNQEQGMIRLQRALLQFNLSIMFFGMQMQRTFQGIAQASLTTFNKLNTDTESANNTMTRLGAAMEGVRYVIGDAINAALEPMEGILMNILDWVMEITDNNQDWIGWAIIIGVIVGGIMMLVGQLGLLFIGIAALTGASGFAGLGSAATTATAAGSKGILGMIGSILAVAAVWGLLIGLFTGAEWPRKLITNFVKLIGNIVIFIVWLALKIIKFLGGAFGFVAELIGNAFAWAFKGVINIVIRAINSILSLVEQMINKIAQSDIGKFLGLKTVSIGRLQEIENKSFGTRLAEMSDKFVAFMQEDDFNLKGATDALSRGVDATLGAGLERMFGKGETAADKQVEAANLNLEAAQTWQSILAAAPQTPNAGTVTSTYSNGQLNFYGMSSQI